MVCGDDLPEKALSEALGHCGQSSWPFAEEDFEEDREVVVWEHSSAKEPFSPGRAAAAVGPA